jgi:hypothetical protein
MKSRGKLNVPELLPDRRLVLATVVLAASVAVVAAWSHPASLLVNGERVVSDVPPVTHASEAFVPLRAVGESLGAQISYDPKNGTIEVVRGEDDLRMHVGERVASLNGSRMTLAHAPFELRGRTMVSLSVIARAFGSKVRYDTAHAKIDVVSPGIVEAGAQEDRL